MRRSVRNIISLIALVLFVASCSKDADLYTPDETFNRPTKAGEVKDDSNTGHKPTTDSQASRPNENDSKPVTGPSDTGDDSGGISDDDDDESDDDKSSKR